MLAAGLAALCVCRVVSATELVRQHGFRLDEKHMLLLDQRHREITITMAVRDRSVGNTSRTRTRDEASERVDRFGTVTYLARISVEVLKPSAPNYLRNPGERYRIVIEGLTADPDFRAHIETDAITARAAVLAEFDALGARTHGIQREALHYAGPYVLQVLNDSNLMPAPIPTSIAESRVGRIRFDNPALQRETLEAGRRLYAPKKPRPSLFSPLTTGSDDAARKGGQAEQP